MLSHRTLLACLGLLALTGSCARTVPDTRDADVKAVKAVEAAWVADIATKDADKFASYYADDASLMGSNMPIITGKDNILAALRPMLADPNFSLTFQATHAEASKGGDFVYTLGTYSLTTSDPNDKKPVSDKGKYLTVYKKQAEGSWKVVADMMNSDLPLQTGRLQSVRPQKKTHRAKHAHRRARAR